LAVTVYGISTMSIWPTAGSTMLEEVGVGRAPLCHQCR